LFTLGWNHKYLGAQLGATMVLHTWGQNLSLHPHIHCIVPGGGVGFNGKWKNKKAVGKYLFPVQVMSKVFRGKFIAAFKQILLNLDEVYTYQLNQALYHKDWVVYCKPPFNGARGAIEYLARYTHKIAISNHRILSIIGNVVTIKYKDYRHGGKSKLLKLKKPEFIRRFSLHILPKGFTRIRHYGILSGRIKYQLFPQFKKQQPIGWEEFWKKMELPLNKCNYCKNGILILIGTIPKRGPPILIDVSISQ
jgi:hypothetical protein